MVLRDLLVASLVTRLLLAEAAIHRVKRPFYIIGHMVNSVKEVDDYLKRGANALEADIEFAKNGTVLGTYHGMPCDCFRGCFKREKMADYLNHIREITGKRFDVGMNDPLERIGRMYKALGITRHRWQGDGLSNCVRFLMPVDRLTAAVKKRDCKEGYMDKVYHWTIDLPIPIAKSIRHGVDGIITNRPENVLRVVKSIFFRRRLRVANITDSPWDRYCRNQDEIKEDVDTGPEMLGEEEGQSRMPYSFGQQPNTFE